MIRIEAVTQGSGKFFEYVGNFSEPRTAQKMDRHYVDLAVIGGVSSAILPGDGISASGNVFNLNIEELPQA